jgi:hypothetical protein
LEGKISQGRGNTWAMAQATLVCIKKTYIYNKLNIKFKKRFQTDM